MEGRAADRNHRGEGQGGTHTTGNREGGGIPWGGGGGLAALHHIYIYIEAWTPDIISGFRDVRERAAKHPMSTARHMQDNVC